MAAYLDGLDAAVPPLAPSDRVLAALGPKMLELARLRTAGTHPYLVTPELTRAARTGIGPDGLVASEQGVVLETDPTKAREIARLHLKTYLGLPNYSNNWMRQGFTEEDLERRRQRPTGRQPSWSGATRRRSRRECSSTATPAPTTCASRCSPRTNEPSLLSSGASSRQP